MKTNYLGNDSSKSHLLHIPVPWVYVIAYLVGIVIQLVYPISISSTLILAITRILSGVLLVVGVAIIVWAQLIFHKEHTTTDPTQTSLKLITWGPYLFTRNPMYIGLFLTFIGIDGIFDVCLVTYSPASCIILCQLDSDSSRGDAIEENFWENL